ncbi:hypothetical protein Q5752_000179 [Cryptotrichosporon argae]
MATLLASPLLASTSSAALSDASLDSSDDEAGVFFGPRSVVEDKLIARYVESPGKRRVSGRVRKRDSREILRRRQTLLVDRGEENDDGDKVWDGGFYEKKEGHVELEQGKDELVVAVETTDVLEKAEDELTARLEGLAVGEEAGDDEQGADHGEDDDEYDDSDDSWDSDPEGSDKENSIIPEPYYDEDEEGFVPPEESTVTMGFDKHASGDDIAEMLDLGGLRLSDFEDPDTGLDDVGDSFSLGSTGTISASSSAYDLASGDRSQSAPSPPLSRCASDEGVSAITAVDVFVDTSAEPRSEHDETGEATRGDPLIQHSAAIHDAADSDDGDLPVDVDSASSSTTLSLGASDDDIVEQRCLANVCRTDTLSFVSSASSAPSTPTPVALPLSNFTPPSSAASASPSSPLPTMRGGPVHIPSFPMPAASPMRGLAPRQTPIQLAYPTPVATELADLTSPTKSPRQILTLTPIGIATSCSPTKSSPSKSRTSPAKVSALQPRAPILSDGLVLSPTLTPMSKTVSAPSAQRSMKILKSSSAPAPTLAVNTRPLSTVPASVDRPRPVAAASESARDAAADLAARKAVREQLGAAFAPRLAAFPPASRSASGSSSSSASSSGILRKPETKLRRPASTSTLRQPTASVSARAAPLLAASLSARPAPARPPPAIAMTTSASRFGHRSTFLPKPLPPRPAGVVAKPRVVVPRLVPSQPTTAMTLTKVAKPLSRPEPTVPLKRPLPTASTASRVLVPLPLDGIRSGLGLGAPARLRDGPSGLIFEEYVEPGMPARPAFRSPARLLTQPGLGTPLATKTLRLGTPSRLQVTPKRPMVPMPLSASKMKVAPATQSAAPSIKSTTAAEPQVEEAPRGSSEDREEVSMIVPGSSEVDSSPVTRSQTSPSRSASASPSQRPATRTSPTRSRPKRTPKPVLVAAKTDTIVPGMSEKELKAVTARHTAKNEVYVSCAIDKQVVRVPGPRPPSPTSKIPTLKQREEEGRKAQRTERARRRKGQDSDDDEHEHEHDNEHGAVVTVHTVQGPGEDEAWVTPPRPSKKARLDDAHSQAAVKSVTWDKGLHVIRGSYEDMGRVVPVAVAVPKSCIPAVSRVRLDHLGNVIGAAGRVVDKPKRARVVVSRRFFDGEDVPVEVAASGRAKKKRG